jgi:uncharacterized membrane protein
VIVMVLAHVSDAWTREADRGTSRFFLVVFVSGIASPLFLFLAGVATAMSAGSKGRRQNSRQAGAALARRRGWEIFVLGLVFRVQAQVLGLGPLSNLFKVDMLNAMGLSIVAVSYVWQAANTQRARLTALAVMVGAIAMLTPVVRDVSWLAPLPDPLEAYLRPAGRYGAFPLFAWAGFAFAGAIVGDVLDAVRQQPARHVVLMARLALFAGGGIALAWLASFLPTIYNSASFWHDSPTFFFIRLGLVALLVPLVWVGERALPPFVVQPLTTLGRSSLFVYWIHIEMVYGVIAEPIRRQLPLWASLMGTALLTVFLYQLVVVKNRLLAQHELSGPWRLLAPIVR